MEWVCRAPRRTHVFGELVLRLLSARHQVDEQDTIPTLKALCVQWRRRTGQNYNTKGKQWVCGSTAEGYCSHSAVRAEFSEEGTDHLRPERESSSNSVSWQHSM